MFRYKLRTLLLLLAIGLPVVAFGLVASRNPESTAFGLIVWLLFSTVGLMTRLFAGRPRLFVRTFVPKEELRDAVRKCIRDPSFEPSMRMMRIIQLVFAIWVGAIVAIGSCFQ